MSTMNLKLGYFVQHFTYYLAQQHIAARMGAWVTLNDDGDMVKVAFKVYRNIDNPEERPLHFFLELVAVENPTQDPTLTHTYLRDVTIYDDDYNSLDYDQFADNVIGTVVNAEKFAHRCVTLFDELD